MARNARENPAKYISARSSGWITVLAGIGVFTLGVANAKQPQPPAPCHPNPHVAEDRDPVADGQEDAARRVVVDVVRLDHDRSAGGVLDDDASVVVE